MQLSSRKIPRVYIITGFLGAGKTTLIQSLLQRKPAHERWGVLVNEFGEVGVDGSFLAGLGVAIKEVAGGCMCCAAGVPMRVALTQLLRTQALDCLIIEPSGLGHTATIIEQLSAPEFAAAISLKSVITLVDPRQLQESRYREHPIFAAQITAATHLLATKSDQVSAAALEYFDRFANALTPAPITAHISHGDLDLQLLDRGSPRAHNLTHRRTSMITWPISEIASEDALLIDVSTLKRLTHANQDFMSIGWLAGANITFDAAALFDWMLVLSPLRAKASVNTAQGCWTINMLDGQAEQQFVGKPTSPDSRIEFIFDIAEEPVTPELLAQLNHALINCVTQPPTGLKIE